MAIAMLITAVMSIQYTAFAYEWKLSAEALVNGTDHYQDGETLKIPEGADLQAQY